MKLSIFRYGQTSETFKSSAKIVKQLEIPNKQKV